MFWFGFNLSRMSCKRTFPHLFKFQVKVASTFYWWTKSSEPVLNIRAIFGHLEGRETELRNHYAQQFPENYAVRSGEATVRHMWMRSLPLEMPYETLTVPWIVLDRDPVLGRLLCRILECSVGFRKSNDKCSDGRIRWSCLMVPRTNAFHPLHRWNDLYSSKPVTIIFPVGAKPGESIDWRMVSCVLCLMLVSSKLDWNHQLFLGSSWNLKIDVLNTVEAIRISNYGFGERKSWGHKKAPNLSRHKLSGSQLQSTNRNAVVWFSIKYLDVLYICLDHWVVEHPYVQHMIASLRSNMS